jgi:hypothetical protein
MVEEPLCEVARAEALGEEMMAPKTNALVTLWPGRRSAGG